MKATLITLLETICPNNVFLHGSIASNVAYPDSFITFYVSRTSDNSFYNDEVHSVDWTFLVYYYTSDPSNMSTVPTTILTTLKNNGFIPQGKGYDIISDVETHTGWVQEFIYTEIINNNNQ